MKEITLTANGTTVQHRADWCTYVQIKPNTRWLCWTSALNPNHWETSSELNFILNYVSNNQDKLMAIYNIKELNNA